MLHIYSKYCENKYGGVILKLNKQSLLIALILLISCLAISTVSAADTNNADITVATSDIELESVNEANILLDNENQIELDVSSNNTNDENKNAPESEGIYTNNGDNNLNNTKVTPIINVDDVIIKNGENIIIPFNVTDNEGNLIPGGAIVSLNWMNNTVSQYVELENGKGLANFSVELLIGKVSDSNSSINFSDLIKDILKLLNLNSTSESNPDPINISEDSDFDIFNLFNITIPDYSNIINNLNITLPNITMPDYSNIFNNLNVTLPDIADLFDSLNVTLPDIADLFDSLNITLPNITELINSLNVTLPDIADLIDSLNITLPNITEIIGNLNVTLHDIADLSDSLNINLPNITELINSLNVTLPNVIDLIDSLNVTLPDIADLFDSLNVILPNVTDLINNLNITLPNITELIDSLNVTLPNITFDLNRILNIISSLFEGDKGIMWNYTFIPGTYNITIKYIGDENYADAISEGKLIITGPNMVANDIVMYYKDGTRYVVNLTDYEGNPLFNQTVTITINGQKYDRTTDDNGSASLTINLNAGNYTVSALYGTNIVENTITILSTIEGNDIIKVFRNDTQYYATFFDKQGKALAEGTDAIFNINGVMYERKVNENGTARLNINLNPGEYIITATNPVTGEKHSNNITVLANIISGDLVKYYKNDSQYIVTILGNDGKVVGAGETVKFNINGVFYERQTNASGQAKLNINLSPGEYIITGEYNGCKVSNNIKVKSILATDDLTKTYSQSKAFETRLVGGQGNPLANETVKFNINGVLYDRVTDSNGVAKLNINLQKGEYIITSTYNGLNIANTVTVTE